MMKMMQHSDEIKPFIEWLLQRGPLVNVLEIGTGHGGLTELLASVSSGWVVSVDLPGSGDVTGLARPACVERNARLRAKIGDRFYGIFGHSQSPDVVNEVLRLAPFDLVFLDGADSKLDKMTDFGLYHPMARLGGVVATHDIRSFGCGVPSAWRDLQTQGFRVKEFVSDAGLRMGWGGIGVVLC